MAWDFTVDSDIQLDMAKYLKEKADELDTQFANLYTQIGPSNLGTHWVGSDYDAFNVGCEGYKQALADMTDSVRMYADHFERVAEGTDMLSSLCISVVQNMTTRGDALPGSGGATAPGGTTGTTGGTTNTTGGTTNTTGGTTNTTGGTTNTTGGTTNTTGGTTNTTGGTTTGQGNPTGGNTSGQSNVTGVWKSYQDAADAGYPNIKTAHEFARGGYDKDKYGTYDNYLAAMQERYVGSTYQQDTSGGYGKGSPTGSSTTTTTTTPQGGNGTTQTNGTQTTNNGATAWTVGGAIAGGLVGGIPGAIVGGLAGNAVGNADSGVKSTVGGAAAGYLLGGLPGAVVGGIAGKTIDGYKNGEFKTAFEHNDIYKGMGEDFANNFDYSNCDGLVDGAFETVSGVLKTGGDMVEYGTNIVHDTVDTGIDAIQYAVFDRDENYWNNLGDDFSENFDYSNCDGLWDGAVETVTGVGETLWDAGEVAVNGVVDAAQWLGDRGQDLIDWIF